MADFVCPKCGFEQDRGTECGRCGIVFDRYRSAPEPLPPMAPTPSPGEVGPSTLGRFYRVLRWVVLVGIVVLVVLVLADAPPPQVDTQADAGRAIQVKMMDLQTSMLAGRSHSLRLGEAEVNFWLGENLALQENPSDMQDLRINLNGDLLRVYLVFISYGQDLSLILEGRVRVKEGYLDLEPTAGQLGSFPIPRFVLNRAVQRLFESTENREKFKLPQEINDIRVENSELVISFGP